MPIAQSAERRSVEPEVGGSSPLGHPSKTLARNQQSQGQSKTRSGPFDFVVVEVPLGAIGNCPRIWDLDL